MDIALIILGVVFLVVAFVGCIVPGLPGVPFAYVALLCLHFTDKVQFSWWFLLIWGIIVTVIQVMDFVVPAWGTKKFGGSKAGVWGSTIGLIVGLILAGWGVLICPFAGAVIGELCTGKNFRESLRAGFGSFIGLLAGTLLKLVCCGIITVFFVVNLF